MDEIYEKLSGGKKISEALLFFSVNNFDNPEQGDLFFNSFGVGNNNSSWNKYERFICYEELLKEIQTIDQNKYQKMHKGTAYYFLYWLAFELRLYEKAIFYLDGAVSEDIRKTIKQAKREHPEQMERGDDELRKFYEDIWSKNPAITDLCFKDGGTAVSVRLRIYAILKEQIDRFNQLKINGVPNIDVSKWGDNIVIPLLSKDIINRSLLSAFYSFLLSYADNVDYLKLRSTNKGTIEPFLVHLYKGGLLFETLLKYLSSKYNYTDTNGKHPTTLGQFNSRKNFTNKYSDFEARAESWNDVYQDIETNDIKGIFSTVARTRNFTGHDLRRDDDFSNEKYQKLVEREMDAMFIIIAKEFFYGIT